MEKTYQTCKLIKNRVDLYLYEMAILFANLGTDSTVEEVKEAYAKEAVFIDKIEELDPVKARSLRTSY
jgi:hypothetical protein|tara:strand:- start:766 stop:969 length:204 start_codon:yes stop_codon:yes gene_type:complete